MDEGREGVEEDRERGEGREERESPEDGWGVKAEMPMEALWSLIKPAS